jgi:gamma-tubulin complex component 5
MTESTPRLLHLSLGSQASILATLGRTATIVQHLRQFVRLVFESLQGHKSTLLSHNLRGGEKKTESTRTQEAFADAVDHEIRLLDNWCAAREEAMCRAWGGTGTLGDSPHDADDDRLVISLLRTEKDVRDTFERTFEVLLVLTREIFPPSTASTTRSTCPAAINAALLDRLFESVQEHLERREKITSEALMRVFVRTAEPVWDMLGRWLRDGMGLGVGIGTGNTDSVRDLEEEFFIESSGLGLGMMGVGLLDPEFWKEGYTLRERVVFEGGDEGDGRNEKSSKVVPLFLEHVAELALGAGKAIGLLRALEVPLSSITPTDGDWRPFSHLIGPFSTSPSGTRLDLTCPQKSNGDSLLSVSIDTLSRLIYDELLPRCTAADTLLVDVLVKECDLWKHLESMEDLFLMKKGDAMSHFADVLFAKVRSDLSRH